MNRIYRSIWNHKTGTFVAVAENVKCTGKQSSPGASVVTAGGFVLKALATSLMLAFGSAAYAAPAGGQVVSGTGAISQTGTTTTVNQSSQHLSLNWQSFNIAPQETVNFVQPSAAAIAVNRIFDTNGTQILGRLNANGQVYLINPNGILFGQGAQVNVGGLVASTLELNGAAMHGDTRSFSGNGSGSIVNQGTINAASGGYVALLGNRVSNQGTITAPRGTVALGAGNAVTLTFQDNSLVKLEVDQSVLNSLAENGGLIRADGGKVFMSAGARDALLASVVNNTGVIEARTVENREGTIVLMGGMAAGTTNVGGTLDASAPTGGDGGFIETSAAHVKVADDARVTTAASMGLAGSWLIDPVDFTIAASGGDMTGATLTANLAGGNVKIQSTSGSAGTAGNLNVNDTVSWSANKLTLNAQNNININTAMYGSGTASLAFEYGQGTAAGNTSTVNVRAPVNLPAGNNFSTKQGFNGVAKNYKVITSLGAAGSMTAADLQGMNGNLNVNYALGADIDAAATSSWNAGAGFAPIGGTFKGDFDGLGHKISNLTINRGGTNNVGLFGTAGTTAVIRNVGLVGGSVSGGSTVGALVGQNSGSISNSYATSSVSGGGNVGGLVGWNQGGIGDPGGSGVFGGGPGGAGGSAAISNSYAAGTVSGTGNNVGGLVGWNQGGNGGTGGAGTFDVEGRAGGAGGSAAISNSYAAGTVSGTGNYVGGLVGLNQGGTGGTGGTGGSYGSYGGGAGGAGGSATISNSYAAGNVNVAGMGGGLIGSNVGGALGTGGAVTITNSFWNTTTTGQATSSGGVGMTTAQMQAQANFTSATVANGNINPAWDFSATWVMYEGYTAPLLRSFMTPLTVTANSVKTYDGQAYSGGNVIYSTLPNANLLGSVSFSGTSQGAINAGSYVITPGGLYSNQQGYIISYADGTLTVNKANLSIGTGNVSKTYDGTTAAAGSVILIAGTQLFGTDSLSGGTFAFTDKNAGIGNKTVTVSGVTVNDGNGGNNYNVSYVNNATSTITPKTLTISGTTAADKTYDGSTAAAITAGALSGLVEMETVTVTATGTFDSANAGNRSASASYTLGNGLNGGLAANYALAGTSGHSATINKAALTISANDVTKTYDGTLTAAGTARVASGTLFGTDSLSGGTFTFADKNAGTGKTVNVSSVTVADGNGGGNYNVSYVNNTTSTITPKALTIGGITAGDKVYDGTTAATVNTAAASYTGLVSGDDLTLSATGLFADKNAANNKTVTLVSTYGGADVNNYSITGQATATASITPANLAVTNVTANSKLYDGTIVATLSGTPSVTAFGTDVVTVTGIGQGAFADPSVGSGKAVVVSGYTLSGADAGNYTIVQPMGLTADINNGAPSAQVQKPAQVQNTIGELQANVLPFQPSSASAGRDASSTITMASGNPDAAAVIVGGTSPTAAANTSADAATTASGNNTSHNGIGNTVVMNVGTQGSKLHIVNGGVRLPANLTNDNGK